MVFNDKTYSANMGGHRYVIQQGGTGSGKTFSVLQYLLTYANKYQGCIISVVSETLPHLKRGALRDMKRIIAEEGWENVISENKSEHIIKIGKSTIEFFPADSASKLRGARRDILFINECNNVDYESFQQLDVRTRKRTILDFNPVRRFWVHDELIPSLAESEYCFVQSTFADNICLSEAEKENILRRRNNSNWWRIYGEGQIGVYEGLIFNNWSIVDCPIPIAIGTLKGLTETPSPNGEGRDGAELPGVLSGYGIDFGFTSSPTAVVQLNEFNGELYVKEMLYRTNLSNDALFAFASTHLNLDAKAVADSAEPKTIHYLRSKGWKGLKAAIKGPDSVNHGINMLLDRKINVTKGSLNLIKELREYMWDTDGEGKNVNKPVKEYDHAIDALRYLYSYPKKKQIIII